MQVLVTICLVIYDKNTEGSEAILDIMECTGSPEDAEAIICKLAKRNGYQVGKYFNGNTVSRLVWIEV